MRQASLLAAVIVVTLVTMAAVLLNESGMIHAVQFTLRKDYPIMKPSELATALKLCIQAKQPVCAWGKPGIGKSQVVSQVGSDLNLTVKDVRAVLLDPVDLRGLPHVNGDGRSHWAIPEFLPRDGSGILFLDELNRAPALVQNACFQLVLDRKLGEYSHGSGISGIVGNRSLSY